MIDTKALRKKILDLAISGKLTEQLPEDGNAEDLYAQIQEEKARLIAEGKIKKEKPLPPIADEEIPFDIPENWKWVRLKDISQIINGDRGKNYPAKSLLKKEGIPFISALNLNGKNVTVDDRLLCLSDEQYDKLGSGKLESEDVVICIRGSLGKHGKYQFDRGAIASSLVISRAFLNQEIIGAYEMMWLDSTMFPQEIKKYDGGSAQPNLAANNLEKFLFPLPPLAEQKRIVSAVEDAFAVIERIEKAQEYYYADQEVLKNKIIDAGIRGKLTEQLPEDGNAEDLYAQIQEEKARLIAEGKIKKEKPLPPIAEEEIPFDIPENWKWVRFAETGSFRKGPFGSALTKSMFVPKGNDTVKVYEQQNAIKKNNELGTYYISRDYFEDKMKGFEVQPGDIIVSCAGTIGETYILPDDIEKGIINQALMKISLSSFIDKNFFLYYFDSFLKYSANEESNGSAIKNIPPFDVMKKWCFPLPPITEQTSIVEKIDESLLLMV